MNSPQDGIVDREELCRELDIGTASLSPDSRARLSTLKNTIRQVGGTITWPQLLRCCSETSTSGPGSPQRRASPDTAKTIFEQFDTNADGVIDPDEFATGLLPRSPSEEVQAPRHISGHAANMLRGIQSELNEAKRMSSSRPGSVPRPSSRSGLYQTPHPRSSTPRHHASLTPRMRPTPYSQQISPRGSTLGKMSSSQEVNSAESMVDNALRRERELKDKFTDDAVKQLKGEVASANQAINSLESECGSLNEELRQAQDALQAAARLAEQVPGLQDRLMQEHSALQAATLEADQLRRALDDTKVKQESTNEELDERTVELQLARRQVQDGTRAQQDADRRYQEKERALGQQLTDALNAAKLANEEAEKEKRRADEAENAARLDRDQAAREKSQLQDSVVYPEC